MTSSTSRTAPRPAPAPVPGRPTDRWTACSTLPGSADRQRRAPSTYQDVRLGRHRGARPAGVSLSLRGRRVHRDHGPVRVRQVDPHARHGRARQLDPRRGLGRRRRAVRAQGQGPDRAAPRPGRLHLPAVQPAADADRAGEHHPAARHRRPPGRPGLARRGRRAPSACGDRLGAPADRAVRRPAAAGRLRPRAGQPARRWCSPTSRPATSTRGPAPRCCRCCASRCASSARPSSWSPTTRWPRRTPTASSSWPTAGWSASCATRPPSRCSTGSRTSRSAAGGAA